MQSNYAAICYASRSLARGGVKGAPSRGFLAPFWPKMAKKAPKMIIYAGTQPGFGGAKNGQKMAIFGKNGHFWGLRPVFFSDQPTGANFSTLKVDFWSLLARSKAGFGPDRAITDRAKIFS